MGSWLIGGLVLAIILFAAYTIYKDRRAGKMCGDCAGCGGGAERRCPR